MLSALKSLIQNHFRDADSEPEVAQPLNVDTAPPAPDGGPWTVEEWPGKKAIVLQSSDSENSVALVVDGIFSTSEEKILYAHSLANWLNFSLKNAPRAPQPEKITTMATAAEFAASRIDPPPADALGAEPFDTPETEGEDSRLEPILEPVDFEQVAQSHGVDLEYTPTKADQTVDGRTEPSYDSQPLPILPSVPESRVTSSTSIPKSRKSDKRRIPVPVVSVEVPAQEVATPVEPSERYGCHCDLAPGQEPDSCVIDQGHPEFCHHALAGVVRDECSYWRPISMVRSSARKA